MYKHLPRWTQTVIGHCLTLTRLENACIYNENKRVCKTDCEIATARSDTTEVCALTWTTSSSLMARDKYEANEHVLDIHNCKILRDIRFALFSRSSLGEATIPCKSTDVSLLQIGRSMCPNFLIRNLPHLVRIWILLRIVNSQWERCKRPMCDSAIEKYKIRLR